MFFNSFNNKKIYDKLSKNLETPFKIKEVFEDKRLQEEVANALGVSINSKVTLKDLEAITTLNAPNKGIESLVGLEFLNNLIFADFSNNNIRKLPDYTLGVNGLYNNKNTVININLANNPFLDKNNLFSLNSTEQRRKFINQFEDAAIRFNLGPVHENVFTSININPFLLYEIINYYLPNEYKDRDKVINDLIYGFILGNKIFYSKDIYNNNYILDKQKVLFRGTKPQYLNGLKYNNNIKSLVPVKDLYLIKSLINNYDSNVWNENYKELEKEATLNPILLSNDFILVESKWEPKTDFSNLDIINKDNNLFEKIKSESLRNSYLSYEQLKNSLLSYKEKNSVKAENIDFFIRRSDRFINDFLNNYISVQDNSLLDDSKRSLLFKAENSFNQYLEQLKKETQQLVEQDIFNLEVDMKYLDSLLENTKSLNDF